MHQIEQTVPCKEFEYKYKCDRTLNFPSADGIVPSYGRCINRYIIQYMAL